MFDRVPRGDPHWLSIQFMKSQKVDRVAAAPAAGELRRRVHRLAAGLHHADPGGVRREDDDNGSAAELAEACPTRRSREVPGTHMSSVTKPEFGEAIAALPRRHKKRGARRRPSLIGS